MGGCVHMSWNNEIAPSMKSDCSRVDEAYFQHSLMRAWWGGVNVKVSKSAGRTKKCFSCFPNKQSWQKKLSEDWMCRIVNAKSMTDKAYMDGVLHFFVFIIIISLFVYGVPGVGYFLLSTDIFLARAWGICSACHSIMKFSFHNRQHKNCWWSIFPWNLWIRGNFTKHRKSH